MAAIKKNANSLTRKEQATTGTYKLLSEKIDTLEASLKKTQDESETIRSEKIEIEKRNVLLEEKFKDYNLIVFIKFLTSAGFGFALNYIAVSDYKTSLSIGLPCIVIYGVSTYLTRK